MSIRTKSVQIALVGLEPTRTFDFRNHENRRRSGVWGIAPKITAGYPAVKKKLEYHNTQLHFTAECYKMSIR